MVLLSPYLPIEKYFVMPVKTRSVTSQATSVIASTAKQSGFQNFWMPAYFVPRNDGKLVDRKISVIGGPFGRSKKTHCEDIRPKQKTLVIAVRVTYFVDEKVSKTRSLGCARDDRKMWKDASLRGALATKQSRSQVCLMFI
jgi:hypothetical protein